MTILAQSQPAVKPIIVTHPYAWGFEDGANGLSVYEGLNYWTLGSGKYAEYEAGHKAGKEAKAGKALRTAQVAPASDPVLVQWQAEGSPMPTNWFTRPDSEYRQMDAEMRPLNIERW